ncbi:DegV family protein [Exiguobacterium oxidotolerans]|uniref:Fatty acid kinase fatty acid binding subunit A n=1 Tax=Exiguobacterium oxidotolerans TaxID=223958 RepID=A0A653I9Y0_9BACL|nr:DegV family protein [Exiguobacterium oxidotolerans]VWX35851.1 fatty acid kinase fatty acid binding subunit A [Exiguobacterium oxidotolerans]
MSQIVILTDSTAYLPTTYCEENNVHVAPLSVIFDGDAYREGFDISVPEFYAKIQTGSLPTTSQPNIGDLADAFERLPAGTDIIGITLSSGISGTYQALHTINMMVDHVQVHPVDSRISCMPQAFLVKEAVRMRDAGATATEIVARLEDLKGMIRAYFVVDDLEHLQRGGRLSMTQAVVGSFLKIKPVLHFVDGKIVPFEKIRTFKRAVKRIEEMMEDTIHNEGAGYVIGVIHAEDDAKARAEIEVLEQRFPKAQIEMSVFGPVIGTHLGPGAIGITWYKAD